MRNAALLAGTRILVGVTGGIAGLQNGGGTGAAVLKKAGAFGAGG